MNDEPILKALQSATIEAVTGSIVPTLPIKFLGRVFNIPSDQKWLECVFISNNPQDRTIDDLEFYRGIYRLILHWPVNDAGAYEPMRTIASIGEFFSKGKLLWNGAQHVRVVQNSKPSSPIENGAEMLFPLSVEYSSTK